MTDRVHIQADPTTMLAPFRGRGPQNPTVHFLINGDTSFASSACDLNGVTSADVDEVTCGKCKRMPPYRAAVAVKESRS